MRINSSNVSSNKPTRSVSSDQAVGGRSRFSQRIDNSVSGPKATLSKSWSIRHEELMALASDFKNGLINREEANSRFVNAVVEASVQGKLAEKDRQAMTKDIADFFADDRDFMNKLQKNLRDIA